jgi:glycosyltransferase involved in cell wall biosynthesis
VTAATVFFAFRDAPDRRAALGAPGSLDRYRLFGLDEIARRGVRVRHNLEGDAPPPGWARAVASVANASANRVIGLGGDFATVLASLRTANTSEVVFATVDTVGIPLLLFKATGIVRPPLVYTSIGLSERLERLHGDRGRHVLGRAFGAARAVVAYSAHEADVLREWVGPSGPPVVFVPFGVDVDRFRPMPDGPPQADVVSAGADPRRDYQLLAAVAARHPELTFRIVASADQVRGLVSVPKNVRIETNLSLEAVRDRLATARVVALPVHDNTYSGATTVLLQAMAMAKPVVVSRTDAIARGYDLEDGFNCRLVEPGDLDAFERTLVETLAGADAATSLGIRARETVERSFSWERYADALWEVLFPVT